MASFKHLPCGRVPASGSLGPSRARYVDTP